MQNIEPLQHSDIESGVQLRSTIDRIAGATVIQQNADGTYKIKEVDHEAGSYVYDSPIDEINYTFYVP